MTRRLLPAAGVFLRYTCGLAVLTLSTAACRGEARDTGPQTTSGAGVARGAAFDPKTYPLDEAKLRKMGAVMRAWDPKGPEPTSEDPTVYVDRMAWMRKGIEFENKVVTELLSQNSTATLESIPELRAAMAREGFSPREFAAVYLAYKTAEGELMVTGLEQLSGAIAGTSGSGSPPPAPRTSGALKENLELIRRMDKEGTLPEAW
jgi:hypothetical protein